MPKMKTNSGAKKRLKKKPGGKVKFKHQGRRHLNKNKSHKRKRQLAKSGHLDNGNANMLRVRALLNMPVGG